MFPKTTLPLVTAVLLACCTLPRNTSAGDYVFVDPLLTVTHKSNLVISMGRHEEQVALRIDIGLGIGSRSISMVFKEKIPTSSEAMAKDLGPVIQKLLRKLNSPDLERLGFESLSTDLGLTFDKLVDSNEVIIGGPVRTSP